MEWDDLRTTVGISSYESDLQRNRIGNFELVRRMALI